MRSFPSANFTTIFSAGFDLGPGPSGPNIVGPDLWAPIWLWLVRPQWLAILFGVVEMFICLNEFIDREEILALEPPDTATNDLLELNHRFHGPHQNDVPYNPSD